MAKDIYKGINPLLDSLVNVILTGDTRPKFMNLIRQVESGGKYRPKLGTTDYPFGNPEAKADSTTAAGVYQFTKDAINTAKNRAKNIGFDKGFINLIPNDATQWTDDEADIMFMANMFSSIVDPNNPLATKGEMYSGLKGRSGLIDSLLAESYKKSPSIDAIKDLYYTIHHTDPDEATKKRVELIIK